VSIADRRERFRQLHSKDGIFVMPNAWDEGSARLLAWSGFEAIATTSAGFAWTLGRNDQSVTRDELVAHVERLAAATDLPLSVDSERLFAPDPAGVAETVRLLAAAGAAGCSIEDYDPATGRIEPVDVAAERVAAAAAAAHEGDAMVLTARAENHLHGVHDIDDTVARLVTYAGAGADAVYAPGLADPADIRAVVTAVGVPVNVLALPDVPSVSELAALGVRRVSTGSLLASAAYGAMLAGARELRTQGSSEYGRAGLPRDVRTAAF
jgi:2-methylisocitrate lyase-like PEP mutase family enzyme